MLKQFIVTSSLALLLILPIAAQAQSTSDALTRMDAIIKQMQELRAEFAKLSANTAASVSAPAPAVLGVQSGPVFTELLEYGETNNDIKRIQKLLATDPEIYPYGVASGFFGPKTEEALKNLQARNGWSTPGVVGPATRALLEGYFKAYPDEDWPADVLKSDPPEPQVQGVSISTTPSTAVTPTASVTSTGSNLAREINVTFDDDEALIEIIYTNGNRKGLVADTDEEDEVVTYITERTVLTEVMVEEVIDFDSRSSRDDDADEEEAEDALDDAEEALDDAEEAIEEAEEDDEDTDWAEDTLDEADELFEEAEEAFDDEDYDEAIELAEEAEELAEEAEDRIGEEEDDNRQGDADEIDEIEVEIDDGESEVTVKYEDDDDYEFTVEEDDEDDLIEEIADELDIDEDDVEDLVEFDYGNVDRIEVTIDDDDETALARVFYKSGVERRVRLDTTDEDEIIEEVADEIDEDEDDVEDWTEFD